MNPEDFYSDDDMVITISHMDIKRTGEFHTKTEVGWVLKERKLAKRILLNIYILQPCIIIYRCLLKKVNVIGCVFELPEGSKN